MVTLVLSVLIAANFAATPKVYKCVDANGTTVFSPNPCSNDPGKVTEVDTSRALLRGDSPAVRDISNSVAINSIDHNCKLEIQSTSGEGDFEIATYTRQINSLKASESRYNDNAAGAAMIAATETRIASVEAKRLAAQTRIEDRLTRINEDCQKRRDEEVRRQAAEKSLPPRN